MPTYLEFAQILEKKIRKEIERELHPGAEKGPQPKAEIHSDLWTHLVGHVHTRHFEAPQKGQAYHRFKASPRPRPDHVFSEAQDQAFTFFTSRKANLNRNFSAADLKKAFRHLALKLHPDQGGTSVDFQQLLKARLVLQEMLETPSRNEA